MVLIAAVAVMRLLTAKRLLTVSKPECFAEQKMAVIEGLIQKGPSMVQSH
jgi:hypothetical protein